ncbi:hypothetical protein [Thermodesulfovibrio thiophilus]|uniref:hypothetical protein n=1 Tax=Thermodesulfovibrio thiophilus TaxID=340095 RepID=UPI000413531D|nr:hypothetical protein [Thermodesulfovibrio thiophilus]
MLADKDIWCFEDSATNSWYKFNSDREQKKEIFVIKDGNPYPLSRESSIVRNMQEIKQIRLYVKPDDKTKAKEVLKNHGK